MCRYELVHLRVAENEDAGTARLATVPASVAAAAAGLADKSAR